MANSMHTSRLFILGGLSLCASSLFAADGVEIQQPALEEKTPTAAPEINTGATRVMVVPEFVRQQIREQVRAELREDVARDVLARAKDERWGVPGVLPEWLDHIKIHGDLRNRAQGEFYSKDNADSVNRYGYAIDFNAANRAGGYTKLGNPFINTTTDRERLRSRIRVNIDAMINSEIKTLLTLSSGNSTEPISTNQTLGNYGNRFPAMFDQAVMQYNGFDSNRYPWLSVSAGRMANPWLYTDLVWDPDLMFDGLTATYRLNLRGSNNLLDQDERDRTLSFTAGVFPIQEVALSRRDKWLIGGQTTLDLTFSNQSQFKFGIALYEFKNIAGRRNTLNSIENDYTAPDYMQKGNTLFDIRNDADPSTDRWALAADFRLVNVTGQLDLAQLAPYHIVLTGDIVKNIGYDQTKVESRTAGSFLNINGTPIPRVWGAQLQASIGWPRVSNKGTWRVWGAYKYLQRDAVLDAVADSDFHMGGTDAKGWVVGGEYAVHENTLFGIRWLSANAIDGDPLGVDVLFADIATRF